MVADYEPAARAPGERSYGEVIDDAGITMAVKSKLLWSKNTDGLQTEVTTRNGVVTLQGTADTAVASELAGALALNTHDVTSVDNQLLVVNAGPSLADNLANTGDAAGQQISDSWITTKVKSTFIYSSGAERALAIELAQADALAAQGLLATYAALEQRLHDNQFLRPVVLDSLETADKVAGEIYAVIPHPFASVSAALHDPGHWCDVMSLHINTKYCRTVQSPDGVTLDLYVGRKTPQELRAAE